MPFSVTAKYAVVALVIGISENKNFDFIYKFMIISTRCEILSVVYEVSQLHKF